MLPSIRGGGLAAAGIDSSLHERLSEEGDPDALAVR